MRIAYLGKTQLSDLDLSYLNVAQTLSDIDYYLEITPRYLKGAAFNIKKIYPRNGIFKAEEIYVEFSKFKNIIDLDKVYAVNTHGYLWQLKTFYTNIKLLYYLSKQKYDAIHINWPLNFYEFPLFFLRKKMILTVHDPFPHTGSNTIISKLRRFFSFKIIPHFILLNNAQNSQFSKYYRINPEKIIISKLSCYTYLQKIDPIENVVLNFKYILFFGSISPYKGLDYLLPAMKSVHEKFPDVKLIVAGRGKFHFDISEYRALNYIVFINRFLDDGELVSLIKNSQFVVCPYTDSTQSGVVMSAFAFNKPVIATNVGGLPEMVLNNEYGIIVNKCDVDALKDAIATLLYNRELLLKFERNINCDYNSSGCMSWQCITEQLLQNIKLAVNH